MNKNVSNHIEPKRIHSSFNPIAFGILYLVFLIFAGNVFPAELILTWKANLEPGLAGYKIHYGTSSGNYTNVIDVGNVTSYIIYSQQEDQTYYFAATAYDSSGNESDYSQEVSLYIEPEENFYTDSDETADDWKIENFSTLDRDETGDFDFNGNLDLEEYIDGTDLASSITASDIPQLEIGKVKLDYNWMRVDFNKSFSDPVVIAKSKGFKERQPAGIMICNVDSTGFDIFIPEWDYLNGFHIGENLSYLVIESGSYILNDGTCLEAGCFEANATGSFEMITFNQEFQQVPVVLTTVTTFNEIDTVNTRVRDVSEDGFELCMQQQDGISQNRVTEIISYLAWEPSTGSLGDFNFKVKEKIVNSRFKSILYSHKFLNIPFVFVGMQMTNDDDSENVRLDNEDFKDSEKYHSNEVVGYMLFEIVDQ